MAGPPSDAEIRLLLVEDMPQVAQYIRGLLDTQSRIKLLEVVTDGRAVIEQVREHQPDVLIVDALLQGKINGLQVAAEVREAGMELPIVCLTVPQKPIAIGDGMGETRVLAMPFSGYDFMHLLQQMNTEHRARAPEQMSRVYAMFGAKGGVGTTTLAYNIGAALVAQGLTVAVIDGSLQFGDMRSLLRVPDDAPSIVQLPTNKLQRSELQEAMYRDKSGVEVLLAPPRIELAEMVTVRDLERLISLMRKIYNVVIIDTATTVDDTLLAYLDASDELIQVLTYEWPALQRTRAMTDTLAAINYPQARVRYLANRADSTGGLSRDDIVKVLGRPPDFEVVSDGKLVLDANNRGEPFTTINPKAKISGDVASIAKALVRSMQEEHRAVADKAFREAQSREQPPAAEA
ncbi:MAG: pilus assembly protein CpaE [Chloroflexota bacterium]|nr:pilus assembly protein CpaE [Chloroflexota bacterium]